MTRSTEITADCH